MAQPIYRTRYSLLEIWEIYNKPIKVKKDNYTTGVYYVLCGISPIGEKESFGYDEKGFCVGYKANKKEWFVNV